MKKIGTFISIICIVNVLMLTGLVGYLWGTGRLDKSKAQAIGDMLKQQGSPNDLREKLYEIMTPAPATQSLPQTATLPSTTMAVSPGALTPATAQERIDYVQRVLENERLRLETDAQKLQQQQELLLGKQRQLLADKADLEKREAAYQQKLASVDTKTDAAGFTKTMAIFDELKPRQVKDLLMGMPPADVARYIADMEPDRAAKIMAEFKSADEKAVISGVLDKVRGVKDASGTGAASGSGAASQPVAAASAGRAVN
jgi:flagellar motility protein MotE (MotC chaperone)